VGTQMLLHNAETNWRLKWSATMARS